MPTPAAIAIVGMACRFPDASSPQELWQTVLSRRQAFRRIPSGRLPLRDYHCADRSFPDRTYVREAAVLEGWVFDRVAFRVAGPTFRAADPAHWLALEVAAHALSDAGYAGGAGLPRETTGVHVGNTLTGDVSRAQSLRLRWPYVQRVVDRALAARGFEPGARRELLETLETDYKAPFAPVGEETLAGGLSNTIAGRICNHFDLRGGGYTVDGACASSLLAVIQSCSALVAHDLDVAVAGGVDLSLDPFELVGFARAGALASGRMRVYDARSDGFLPGEGCGMVVLMREADAIAEGRRIYAVLRGWGIASDGSGGLTRPEPAGQRIALDRAYRRAGYGIDSVGYFEGHGTGTVVGDATELGVLMGARRDAGARTAAALGSIKANLGHTKAAAGIAGLLKAALALHQGLIPPTTGCDQPHALLTEPGALLRVLGDAEPWPEGVPPRAAVSAMGFGGIDTHLTLEGINTSAPRVLALDEIRLSRSAQDAELFLFAAADAVELRMRLERVRGYSARLSHAELPDLARALLESLPPRNEQLVRAALVAGSPDQLTERLQQLEAALDCGLPSEPVVKPGFSLSATRSAARVGYLFPGQGAPTRMGAGALALCFPEAGAHAAAVALEPGEPASATRVAQPAIVAASAAGLRLLRALGVEAQVAVGHSLGELTALHWAGAMDEAALIRLAIARGAAMTTHGRPDGAMASVSADPASVRALLGLDADVEIAGYNAPRRTVIAGEARALAAVIERARAAGHATVGLPVSHAFHSRHVAPAAPELARAIARESLAPLTRSVYSTVTGGRLAAKHDLTQLLLEQVTSPVRFEQAFRDAAPTIDLWIEVGPGRVLSTLAAECGVRQAVSLDVGAESFSGLLGTVGAAWSLGALTAPGLLFERRFTRSFELDWHPVFIENPCEAGAAGETEELELPAHPPIASAVETSVLVRGDAAVVPESPLELVRRLISAKAELPLAAVDGSSRLLADLHLNSISVGEILVAAARELGVHVPAAPTDYARATVSELAIALAAHAGLAGTGAAEALDMNPAGVANWVRPFLPKWSPRERRVRPSPLGSSAWHVFSPDDDPISLPLSGELRRHAGPPGVLVCLPTTNHDAYLQLLLDASRYVLALTGPARFVIVQRAAGGASFGRTLALERPDVMVCVVTIPGDDKRAVQWVVGEALADEAFVEVRYDSEGRRHEPVLALAGSESGAEPLQLGEHDVLLVSGGGKGIAAESAIALARSSGARLLILGRSSPKHDDELRANLVRMERAGLNVHYSIADVTDALAVRDAVHGATRTLGPVTAVLHGAGTNEPRLLDSLGLEEMRRTLAPKLDGARNLLAAVDPARLRFFVAFGSVIARTGLRGEGDYGLANEWLSLWVSELAVRLPGCRCLSVEWSVWSGVGMGQRLGRLDSLIAAGVAPLSVDEAVTQLENLVVNGAPQSVVVVSGRLGRMPTLTWDDTPLPLWRFLECPRVHVPGVELIVDAQLSNERDPYLADHMLNGSQILPAVIAMEAMAQVSMALTGCTDLPVFESVEFLQAVVVARKGATTLRVAALVSPSGEVRLVVRSSATRFRVDHVRALATHRRERAGLGPSAEPAGPPPLAASLEQPAECIVALEPLFDLYGRILFHRGRFMRLAGYRHLSSTSCSAQVHADGASVWFGDHMPAQLVLGDPAARDAAIHAIQACIPHQRLLPVSVGRVSCGTLVPRVTYTIDAVEVARDADGYEYDLVVRDPLGTEVERWERLRLASVRGEPVVVPTAPALLATYLERRIGELLPGCEMQLALVRQDVDRDERSQRVAYALVRETAIEHRPDGRPLSRSGHSISLSHSGHTTLGVSAPRGVACDLQVIEARDGQVWEGLLGGSHTPLARELALQSSAAEDSAATRVWCALECLKKAGSSFGAPLTIEIRHPDGWTVLRSGDARIATFELPAISPAAPLVLAVLGSAMAPAPLTEQA